MMSLTCRNIGLGRAKLDLVRCGCSSNGSFYTKWICGGDARKSRASKVVCSRRPNASWCDVLSAQTPKTVFDGNDDVDFISCVGPIIFGCPVIMWVRYDVYCLMMSAWDLHKAWPEAELKLKTINAF
ncbi:hypothetical protein Sjap_008162 [Stephania japonica]|uniref:Uncharacterized protein n=1 Tax=Stephania japonica TaxID=461633 RepID=A0AAP0JQI9_9MAGN